PHVQGMRVEGERRISRRVRDCVRGRLHLGTRDRWPRRPATGVAGGGLRVLRRRSGGNLSAAAARAEMNAMTLLPYFTVGAAFGFVIVEAEVVSWFRIQEMFRFDAFHMYGVIGSAVLTAAVS